jgi:hypothetical protein
MTYGYQTKRYLIPAVKSGDVIDGAEERRAANIIDNQLYGAIRVHCYGHGIIDDGTYTGTFATNNSTVSIRENKPHPTLEGFINQVYFFSNGLVEVTGLLDNTTYYLYVEPISPVDETENYSTYQYGNFTVSAYSTEREQDTRLLIAIVTTTGSAISIDSVPPDKIRTPRLIDHIAINVDPHTSVLYQTELITNQVTLSGIGIFGSMTASGLTADTVACKNLTVYNNIINHGLLVQSGLMVINGIGDFSSGLVAQTIDVTGAINVHGGLNVEDSAIIMGSLDLDSGVLVNDRNIESDYDAFTAHIANYNNPHQTHASGIGALMSSGDTLHGPLIVSSGVTIAGIDLSTMSPLFNGSELTNIWHSHQYSSGLRTTTEYPTYSNTVVSGVYSSYIVTEYSNNDILYKLTGDASDSRASVVCRNIIPTNFLQWVSPFLFVRHVEETADITDGSLTAYIKDTENNDIVLENATRYTSGLAVSSFSISGIDSGTWNIGDAYTVILELKTDSGLTTSVSDYTLKYIG